MSSNNSNEILSLLASLFDDNKKHNYITVLANTSALIYQYYPDINWCGFYLYKNNKLILGPFQGKPACMEIKLDKGVCGYSARNKTCIVVGDVHEFPGHIACDSESNSELVVPIIINDELFGLLDIDSPKLDRFKDYDLKLFKEIVEFIKTLI